MCHPPGSNTSPWPLAGPRQTLDSVLQCQGLRATQVPRVGRAPTAITIRGRKIGRGRRSQILSFFGVGGVYGGPPAAVQPRHPRTVSVQASEFWVMTIYEADELIT